MIRINLTKTKVIAHDKRREARAKALAPLDIQSTIPSEAAKAERDRQVIRDKSAVAQTAIDAAPDVATLKSILETL